MDNCTYCIWDGFFCSSSTLGSHSWCSWTLRSSRTKPPSSSSCLSCARCKNKPWVQNRGGEGTLCAGLLSNMLCNLSGFETFMLMLCGAGRAPGTVHAHTGH